MPGLTRCLLAARASAARANDTSRTQARTPDVKKPLARVQGFLWIDPVETGSISEGCEGSVAAATAAATAFTTATAAVGAAEATVIAATAVAAATAAEATFTAATAEAAATAAGRTWLHGTCFVHYQAATAQ